MENYKFIFMDLSPYAPLFSVALLCYLIEGGDTFCLLTTELKSVFVRSIFIWTNLWMYMEGGSWVNTDTHTHTETHTTGVINS